MTNPQLLDYVRQQFAAGVSKDTVKKALASQGWNESDVNEAFAIIEKPVAQPLTQSASAAVKQSPKPNKLFRSFALIGGLFLVLILGAGSAYAYYKFNPQTFSWMQKTPLTQGTDTTTGGVYSMYCGNNVFALPVVKVAVDIKTAKYDQVKAAIDNAVSNNDTEQLGLLYYFLSRYLAEYQNGVNFQRPPAFSAQGLTPAELSSLFNSAATSTKPFQKQWLDRVSALSSTSTPLQNLLHDLSAGNVKDAGLVLGIAGYREIIEENNFNDGIGLVQCAAQRYYDDLAMYHLGQIYRWGEQQQRFADLIIKEPDTFPKIFTSSTTLPFDNKHSLFWAGATEALDPIKHRVFKDSNYQLGWNNIAILDTILNTDVLSEPEVRQVECKIGVFIAKQYPDLGDSTASCDFSPTSTDTISSYMHTVRNDLSMAQYTVANPADLKDFPLGNCKKLAGSVFDSDKVINDIKTAAGSDASKGMCIAKGKAFAVSVPLPNTPGSSWCVDSSGEMTQIKGSITTIVCK